MHAATNSAPSADFMVSTGNIQWHVETAMGMSTGDIQAYAQ